MRTHSPPLPSSQPRPISCELRSRPYASSAWLTGTTADMPSEMKTIVRAQRYAPVVNLSLRTV